MSTPHIRANKGDFAKTVLMPGDPLRAKFIAETYLENPVQVNDIRGILGYTGTYRGVPVSVMASGMGMPSMAIYSYELFTEFDVENIIRIGTAGAIADRLNLRDVVVGMGSCTNSNYAAQYKLDGVFAPIASYQLLRATDRVAERLGIELNIGNLLSEDNFYHEDPTVNDRWAKMGVLAVEMESASLYMNAARLGRNALAICTISDHIRRGEHSTVEERQSSFTQMMELALGVAVEIN
ncbi:MAG: purine-nucleoside phosphorylase [Clostridia bacterium]|nr:purine-nucleoside phosphorylase [Clostridia bacterium]